MKNDNFSVAVLMSTYNGEKYIREQIDSVLSQRNVDITLIVRDDGSRDATKDIIKKYHNEKIILIEGENIGYAKSFWQLVKYADNYDYYAFCDQDDIWLEEKLLSAIEMLREYEKKPALYTSRVISVNNDKKIISENTFNNTRRLDIYESFQKSKFPGCVFVFNNKARELIKKYDGYMESHDWATYAIISTFGVTVYDSNSYINYRIHENNVIGKQSKYKALLKKGKRFFGKSECSRSKFAKDFFECYNDEIPTKYYEHIECLAYYKKSFLKKIKLLLSVHFKGVVFKILVLLNRV